MLDLMKMPRVPSELVADVASLPDRLLATGSVRGLKTELIERLGSLLPKKLRESPCFLCQLTNLWRYDFGVPIDRLPGSQVVTGTHMFIPVDRLLDVLVSAQSRLEEARLEDYIRRLSNPAKHQDVLAEFAPIIRLQPDVPAQFEVTGYGAGNRTIDWLIHPLEGSPILLEVKCRTIDLIEGLEQIARGERAADGTAPDPRHDCLLLFRNTVEKFAMRNASQFLQGIWVITCLAQEETELHEAYTQLDRLRLHFAILNNWSEDAYIMARDDVDRNRLVNIFRLRKSDRFVFRRGN